jgi:hypothetical protein
MPTVTLTLKSQRRKPVPDRIEYIAVRGRSSGTVQPDEIEFRPAEVVLDLVPDHYTMDLEVGGFKPARGKLPVGFDAMARMFTLENRVSRLPRLRELGPEQRRLLQTLDDSNDEEDTWAALTDNKSATFFQVSHALSQVILADGSPLSSTIDRVVRLGGAHLTAPDSSGVLRTVIGWRMHVVFVGGASIEESLTSAGFKRDPGDAHPTHRRFGFVRSFRERKGSPRLQIVTNHEGTGADVDLDVGAFHRSSPREIYKAFAKRFPDAATVYQVA